MPREEILHSLCLRLALAPVAGLVFAALLLALDIGSLRTLLQAAPWQAPLFFLGAGLAFAPVVICLSVARIAADDQ